MAATGMHPTTHARIEYRRNYKKISSLAKIDSNLSSIPLPPTTHAYMRTCAQQCMRGSVHASHHACTHAAIIHHTESLNKKFFYATEGIVYTIKEEANALLCMHAYCYTCVAPCMHTTAHAYYRACVAPYMPACVHAL